MDQKNEMKRVKLGVLGGGVWGSHHLKAAKQMEMEGYAELCCVGASSRETADRVSSEFDIRGYTNYEEMFEKEDLDLVTVATPDHLHRQMTLGALEKSHVLVEKPLDLSSSGCVDMISLAEANEKLLMVDFHKRYDPYMIEVRNRIQAGELGELFYGYFHMEDKITVPLNNLKKWAEESSPFWFIGVHMVDLLRWVTDQEVMAVSAKGNSGRLEQEGLHTLDAVSVRLDLEKGFTCTIDVNWVIPEGFESLVNQGVRIVGSEGLVEVDTQDRGLNIISSRQGMQSVNTLAYRSRKTMQGYEDVSGYYVDPIKDFIRKIHFVLNGGGITTVKGTFPSGEDGMIATRIAEAVASSVESGETVRVLKT